MSTNIIIDRNYSQYRGDRKPKIQQWLDITESLAEQISETACDVRDSYDIDNATSYELDTLGVIVGIDRGFERSVQVMSTTFGQEDAIFGNPDTTFGSHRIQSRTFLSNEIFTMLIRAKIAKNTNDATYDGILSALKFIIPQLDSDLTDYEDMSFSVTFYGLLNSIQRFVLNNYDLIPRPQGVRFRGYIERVETTNWGSLNWGDANAIFRPFDILS